MYTLVTVIDQLHLLEYIACVVERVDTRVHLARYRYEASPLLDLGDRAA
jgi:hypothetical protein